MQIAAITFDFFNTLVFHRRGPRGRGYALMQYLGVQGLESDDWAHQVLYDVFEPHAREYSVRFSAQQKSEYRVRLAERVFQRLNVRGQAADHATEIWDLIGPASLQVFPDVHDTLEQLNASGYRLGIVSNWQCGLGHFCEELGLAGYFEHIVSSAEIGAEKPDERIFHEMCRLLDVAPDCVLHIGDTLAEDIEGAQRVGARGVWLCRDAAAQPAPCQTISSLQDLLTLVDRGNNRLSVSERS